MAIFVGLLAFAWTLVCGCSVGLALFVGLIFFGVSAAFFDM